MQAHESVDGKFGETNNPLIGHNVSKTELLANLFRKPEIYEQIGSAWFLYLKLTLIEEGKLTATYDQIGVDMATSGKTIRNWVGRLETAGIVKSVSKGHQVSIELLGEHMEIAQVSNAVIQVVETPKVEFPKMSSMERSALEIVQVIEKNGAGLELRVVLAKGRNG